MIEIKTNLGTSDIEWTGTGIHLLAEASIIVASLYDNFKHHWSKTIADAFADTAMELLVKRKEGFTIDGNPIENRKG